MTALPTANTSAYAQWLTALKTRFRQVQLKAAVAVNTELLQFYWALGADIAARQVQAQWGSGFLAQLSQDLMREFPQVKGFSLRNLKYIRQWHAFWQSSAMGQQAVAPLTAMNCHTPCPRRCATSCPASSGCRLSWSRPTHRRRKTSHE